MQNLLERYAQIQMQIADLNVQLADTQAMIQAHVQEYGEVAGYGLRAHYKPGRASTDHEAAARAANVPSEIVEQFSTTKTTVAWAQVTKAAKVDTKPFTVVGEPTFVIEVVK